MSLRSRASAAAILGLTALVAGVAHSDSLPREELLATLRAASRAEVRRHFEPGSTKWSQGWADSAWCARFVDVLSKCRYVEGGVCRVAWQPRPGVDQVLAGVSFHSTPVTEGLEIALRFRERCAQARSGISYDHGSFEIESQAEALFALLKEALPRDSSLKSATLPKVVPIPPPGDPNHPGPEDFVAVDELPSVTQRTVPRYPSEARRNGIEGTVMVRALVGRDGRVKEVRVERSIPSLDAAALEAVREWRFQSAKWKGKPVAVWVVTPVKFTLH